ncbi:uncharacterized protein PHACADRAFT_202299 [Phanerochaete carnosa HHB-10118-sp]|uniref:Uncharacterized protein n=1 Tax=Phanerochaete carnosa (strain HHB-10118-sp) TaxID=650164 RepID=K5VCR6_PHACS|nr:uncharacterized protein PHACADRAFT_202299 [Phanerochaete carnosa HHB-10118-sp]EKM48868.1 hypothetical protein PHACADRAFT_202299 [Phanerochaete carnosa HHB-10118-sp]
MLIAIGNGIISWLLDTVLVLRFGSFENLLGPPGSAILQTLVLRISKPGALFAVGPRSPRGVLLVPDEIQASSLTIYALSRDHDLPDDGFFFGRPGPARSTWATAGSGGASTPAAAPWARLRHILDPERAPYHRHEHELSVECRHCTYFRRHATTMGPAPNVDQHDDRSRSLEEAKTNDVHEKERDDGAAYGNATIPDYPVKSGDDLLASRLQRAPTRMDLHVTRERTRYKTSRYI